MKENQPATLSGACYCGAVRFEVDLPARFVTHCHCENCRRAHGAAFVTFAGFPDGQYRFSKGEDNLAEYRTDTGATRLFCKTCGSTLTYRHEHWCGQETHFVLANIDDPEELLKPDGNYLLEEKAPWLEWPDDGQK